MKRITEVDSLRGVSLLGILIVNIFIFHAPIVHYDEFYGMFEGLERTILHFVVHLFGGKFLIVFSFLFGYSMILQRNKYCQSFKSYHLTRMLILAILGILHITLLWFGDILLSYALLGALMLFTIKCSNKLILSLGIGFILFRPLFYLFIALFNLPFPSTTQIFTLDEYVFTYQNGSFIEILKLRIYEFLDYMPENLIWYIPKTLGFFLIGFYTAKKRLIIQLKHLTSRHLFSLLLLLFVGIIWEYNKIDLFHLVNLDKSPLWRPLLIMVNVILESFMGIGYILYFFYLFKRYKWLAYVFYLVGRLSLTNYILQSTICSLIFYGYGLGYYAKLTPSLLLLISLGIFCFNIGFSHLYSLFYRNGPLEHLIKKILK